LGEYRHGNTELPVEIAGKKFTLSHQLPNLTARPHLCRKNAEYLSTADPFLNLPPTVFMVP
jgi:hypothetical protein